MAASIALSSARAVPFASRASASRGRASVLAARPAVPQISRRHLICHAVAKPSVKAEGEEASEEPPTVLDLDEVDDEVVELDEVAGVMNNVVSLEGVVGEAIKVGTCGTTGLNEPTAKKDNHSGRRVKELLKVSTRQE
mmetsp:Transcript_5579/g.18855  ORF Transcript_5579/g.18855 Transcript_5579/m.18855 type:complete len:138 (-) Transcript_5579:1292-1705(-)